MLYISILIFGLLVCNHNLQVNPIRWILLNNTAIIVKQDIVVVESGTKPVINLSPKSDVYRFFSISPPKAILERLYFRVIKRESLFYQFSLFAFLSESWYL